MCGSNLDGIWIKVLEQQLLVAGVLLHARVLVNWSGCDREHLIVDWDLLRLPGWKLLLPLEPGFVIRSVIAGLGWMEQEVVPTQLDLIERRLEIGVRTGYPVV